MTITVRNPSSRAHRPTGILANKGIDRSNPAVPLVFLRWRDQPTRTLTNKAPLVSNPTPLR